MITSHSASTDPPPRRTRPAGANVLAKALLTGAVASAIAALLCILPLFKGSASYDLAMLRFSSIIFVPVLMLPCSVLYSRYCYARTGAVRPIGRLAMWSLLVLSLAFTASVLARVGAIFFTGN